LTDSRDAPTLSASVAKRCAALVGGPAAARHGGRPAGMLEEARMATRGSGSGMLVSLVIFVTATVALLVLSIVFFAGRNKAEESERQAVANLNQFANAEERNRDSTRALLAEASGRGRTAFGALQQRAADTATFVTGNPAATVEQMRQELAIGPEQSVRSTVGDLRGQLRSRQSELEQVQARLTSANDENTRLRAALDGSERGAREAIAGAESRIAGLASAVEDHRRQTETAVTDIRGTRQQLEARFAQRVRDLEGQIDQLNQDNAILRTRVGELSSVVDAIRIKPQSPAELVDGRILDVLGSDRQVFIDRGSRHRIVPGMTFEVYRDANSISPDPATGAYSRGKASLQVIKVDENTSTARIVRETPGSPVIRGDVVANAVYDPEFNFKFLVFGKFDVDGDGRATLSEAEFVRQRIRDWGGSVIAGTELTGDLDFLVLGVQPPPPGPIPPNATAAQIQARLDASDEFERYQRLFRTASEAQIPVLNWNRFEILTGSVRR
jgi:archaellum component FlaC